jgi:hypothetical protein
LVLIDSYLRVIKSSALASDGRGKPGCGANTPSPGRNADSPGCVESGTLLKHSEQAKVYRGLIMIQSYIKVQHVSTSQYTLQIF